MCEEHFSKICIVSQQVRVVAGDIEKQPRPLLCGIVTIDECQTKAEKGGCCVPSLAMRECDSAKFALLHSVEYRIL